MDISCPPNTLMKFLQAILGFRVSVCYNSYVRKGEFKFCSNVCNCSQIQCPMELTDFTGNKQIVIQSGLAVQSLAACGGGRY